ncbi:MAG: addiction module protein [Polyangiaceae bacterium]
MPHVSQSLPEGFDQMPVEQQIDFVQTLWDRIAAREDDVPVPAWHHEILEARLAEEEKDPDGARPWEDVEAELRQRLSGRR